MRCGFANRLYDETQFVLGAHMALTALMSDEDFDELLNDIYGAVTSGDWQKSLRKIVAITKSNKGFFNIVDVEQQKLLKAEFDFQFNYDPNVLMYYLDNPHKDPFYHAIKHVPEGTVYDFTEYIDIANHEDTDFYQIVLEPMKSHRVLGTTFIRDGKYDSTFAINRGREDLPYSPVDLQFIELISPHFQRAVKLFNALEAEKSTLLLSEAMLYKLNQPILMLDKQHKILLQSPQSKKIIRESSIFAENKGHFVIVDGESSEIFSKLILECFEKGFSLADQSMLIEDKTSKEVYRLIFSSLPNSLAVNNLNVDAVMLTIKSNQCLDVESLKSEYSLTAKELEVIKMYFELRSIEDVSKFLGCTKLTVRNHLQSLYSKLRVTSQTELMGVLRLYLN